MNNSQNEEKNLGDSEYAYKTVMDGKGNSRVWSLVSLICAVFSVCLCFLPWLGLVFGILSLVFAIVSRNNIGYFDSLCLWGLIVGIFGIVFGIGTLAFEYILEYIQTFIV